MNEVASVCKQNHLRLQVQALSSKAQSTQERGFQVSSMAHDGSAMFSYFRPTLPSQKGARKVPQDSTGLPSFPDPQLCV